MKAIARLVSLACALLLSACPAEDGQSLPGSVGQRPGQGGGVAQATMWATNFSRTRFDGAVQHYQLTAGQLSKHPRQGRVMQFVNYEELYFKGLTINQRLTTDIVSFAMDEIMPLSSFADSVVVGPPVVQPQETKVLGNVLNRVVADDIVINFKPSHYPPIILTANHAKMPTDTLVMQFEGHVSLTAKHCQLSADVAIWSNTHNGLWFSEAYQLNHKTYHQPAFFQISKSGRCTKLKPAPIIEYADRLDALEDKLFESIPMPARMLLGLFAVPS